MKRLTINGLCVRLFVIGAVIGLVTARAARPAFAQAQVNDFWVGAVGDWNTAANWSGGVPNRATGQFPVIANGGTAQLSVNALNPIGGLQIGALAVGAVAPDNVAGALEISAGTLTSTNTGTPGIGTGLVTIGTGGGAGVAGTLRMTGGIFNTRDVDVGQNAANLVELSNNAKLAVTGNFGMGGTTRITGSNVVVTATNYAMRASAVFNPVIDSNTAWSTLKTTTPSGVATINGSINVTFTNPVASPLGTTWSLMESGPMVGNFTNGGNVPVAGLTNPLVPGEAYRTRVVPGGAFVGGRKLELVHDRVLVLDVNRDTGAMSIANPLSGAIKINAYDIRSAAGSLKPSNGNWLSLDDQIANWDEANASATHLSELNPVTNGNLDFTALASQTLGNGYDDGAVFFSRGIASQGNDLVFDYVTNTNETIRGQVRYSGVGKTNTLLVTIDRTTGVASLKNDSPGTIAIDGFSLLSAGGALIPGGFNGLGQAELATASPTVNALSQLATNPTNPLRIAGGATFNLGTIFTVGQAETGFSLEFTAPTVRGDYDGNGRIDGSDFLLWQRTLGATVAVAGTGADGDSNGTVDAADLAVWRSGFGLPPGSGTTIFNGVVRFQGGPVVPVPEPATSLLIFAAVGSAGAIRRRRGGSGA